VEARQSAMDPAVSATHSVADEGSAAGAGDGFASVAATQPIATAAAASAAASDEDEEEEEEIVEEASGAIAASNVTAANAAAAATPVDAGSAAAAAAPAATDSGSPSAARSLLASQLRLLLNPFGPLNFSLSLTTEPSIVPLPPTSLYPAVAVRGAQGGGGGGHVAGATFHLSNTSNPNRKRGQEDMVQSADAFWAACKPLREPPLLRYGQQGAGVAYDPAYIAQSLVAEPALAAPDTHLSDAAALQRIVATQAFLNDAEFAPGSEGFRRLWNAHEYFDPYRLLTHPQPPDQPPSAHPSPNEGLLQARFDTYTALLGSTRLVPLPLAPTLSFSSSHVALSLAEVDLLHGLITSARQRDPEAVAHALRAPPKPQDMFLTFVDLSGAEGAAAEFILWRRRIVNLRAKGWGFDLTGTGQPANWSAHWSNATSREQSKNFDVFHAPPRGGADAVLSSMAEENIQMFMRMIDMQTKGVGVQMAVALAHANPAAAFELEQASLSHRPQTDVQGRLLLFQVDVALRTLAKGGSLLLSLYDTHRPLTLSLLFLLFKCFEHVSLHQPAATSGYGGGQTLLVCRNFAHDRVAMRPSANPITAAIIAARQALHAAAPGADWCSYALVRAEEMRANPNFVQWVRRYNQVAHAFQLHCLLTLLQRTQKQANLLDAADPPSATAQTSAFHTLVPVPPPQHRIRITLLKYLGLPVHDAFANAATM